MGTELLRPQDCLIDRLRVAPHVFPRRKSCANNPKPSRRPAGRPDQKKRLSQSEASLISKRSSSDDVKSARSDGNLVMGQVTILRRGESLDSKMEIKALKKREEMMVACGTDRLGPDPEMVPKQIRVEDPRSLFLTPPKAVRSDMYAGSAFSSSPAPSSLPLPSFYKKKPVLVAVDDSATRDLRRMLRLD